MTSKRPRRPPHATHCRLCEAPLPEGHFALQLYCSTKCRSRASTLRIAADPERREHRRVREAAAARVRRSTPEGRARLNEYQKRWYAGLPPDRKKKLLATNAARARANRATPEGRAKAAAAMRRYRARKKEARPE